MVGYYIIQNPGDYRGFVFGFELFLSCGSKESEAGVFLRLGFG